MTSPRALPVVLALAVLSSVPFVSAEDKKEEGPKAVPATTPLELTITGKTTAYKLTKEAAAEYAKAEDTAKKSPYQMPEAPKLDLAFEIRNTSDKPVKVWTGGDPVMLTVTVRGKGALNITPNLKYTEQFISPIATEIAPGKSVSFPLKSLRSGFRGTSHFACWTAPGDYELIVKLETGVSPAPEGSKEASEAGFGQVVLTSAPFAVKVEMAE